MCLLRRFGGFILFAVTCYLISGLAIFRRRGDQSAQRVVLRYGIKFFIGVGLTSGGFTIVFIDGFFRGQNGRLTQATPYDPGICGRESVQLRGLLLGDFFMGLCFRGGPPIQMFWSFSL